MSARNAGSVCSCGTNFSAYFSQGDPLLSFVMTSARKCEYLTFLLSVLACADAILIVSAHQSAYKAIILTHSIKNSIWYEKFDGTNQRLPNSLANLWILIHLLSLQIP